MEREKLELLRIAPASLANQRSALELAYAHLAPADRERRVAQRLAETPWRPVEGLWVAYWDGQLAAATLVQVQPGKTALVSPPRVAAGVSAAVAGQLLDYVIAQLSSRDVRLAQALLETDAASEAQLLRHAGFRHASTLLYLVSLRGAFPDSPPSDRFDGNPLEFVAYSPADHRRLAAIVERTYVGSLDFPAVDGVRQVDDVLEGYRASGRFDPARWLIVSHQKTDVGCLLLTDHPQNDECEVTYMGLVPEVRGRGFGAATVRHAQWLTRQAGRGRLVLAVDETNTPAIAVYASAGFVACDRRSVFLREF